MSPYCPECFGPVAESERRCHLDQHFLYERRCMECDHELYPRERFCSHCGSSAREFKVALLLPPAAPAMTLVASILFDLSTLGLLIGLISWSFTGWFSVLLVPVAYVSYRASARSGGRQTFGQAVFHLSSVTESAGPLGFRLALLRSAYELLWLPKLLFSRSEAVLSLETKCRSLEVVLA